MKKFLTSSVVILLVALLMAGCGSIVTPAESVDTVDVQPEITLAAAATPQQATPPAAPVTASQIIGEWHMTSTDDPVYNAGLSTGWTYDMYFLEDGYGIEWWFSPYSGWQEVMHFTWESNGNGEVTMTYIAADFDVLIHYLGMEFAEAVDEIMQTPFVFTYSVTNNTLSVTIEDITSTYRRNAYRETPLLTSELVGEWHMTSSTAPFYSIGLENDWGYDLYFFDDGTGIEWWFSPESGWHDIFFFTWFARDGEFSITYLDLNDSVVAHYLGDSAVDELLDILLIPSFGEYTINGDVAELYFYNVFTHTMHRN